MPVRSIGSNIGVGTIGGAGLGNPSEVTPGVGFGDKLDALISKVETTNAEANTAVAGMLNGTTDVHEAMLALHEAEEALEITLALRNKFVQAYQDIMRMGI
ncbi:MAG: flagellar hook-basal body complex protein FliE [Vicinamibacterales bacterium]